MRVIGPATEADMVQAFREAEPTRWAVRGYPDRFIFTGFPLSDCRWEWVALTEGDLHAVRHISNEPTWMNIAGPERTPANAVRWVKAHPEDPTARTIRGIHARLVAGEALAPIVLVGTRADSDRVVMDGNKRTVAALMGGISVDRLRFLLGTSDSMGEWIFYNDQP